MKKEVAELLNKAAEELRNDGYEILTGLYDDGYDNYSGRGMFGRRTSALTGPKSEMMTVIAKAGMILNHSDEDAYMDEHEFLDEINTLAWDALGMESIVY